MTVHFYKSSHPQENMQEDLHILALCAETQKANLRFYGWLPNSFTYGHFQDEKAVRTLLPSDVLIARRPTGGGLVDHRNDITYALAFPQSYKIYKIKAIESYKIVHEKIILAAKKFGLNAFLNEAESVKSASLAQCFVHPSKYDVLIDGKKFAGAAQKRNKLGLLFQGSLDKNLLSNKVSESDFIEALTKSFADILCD